MKEIFAFRRKLYQAGLRILRICSDTETATRAFSEFCRSNHSGRAAYCSRRDGINSLEISNASYLSSFTDSTVTLPLDGKQFDKCSDLVKRAKA